HDRPQLRRRRKGVPADGRELDEERVRPVPLEGCRDRFLGGAALDGQLGAGRRRESSLELRAVAEVLVADEDLHRGEARPLDRARRYAARTGASSGLSRLTAKRSTNRFGRVSGWANLRTGRAELWMS